jgi:hypothetical protein
MQLLTFKGQDFEPIFWLFYIVWIRNHNRIRKRKPNQNRNSNKSLPGTVPQHWLALFGNKPLFGYPMYQGQGSRKSSSPQKKEPYFFTAYLNKDRLPRLEGLNINSYLEEAWSDGGPSVAGIRLVKTQPRKQIYDHILLGGI